MAVPVDFLKPDTRIYFVCEFCLQNTQPGEKFELADACGLPAAQEDELQQASGRAHMRGQRPPGHPSRTTTVRAGNSTLLPARSALSRAPPQAARRAPGIAASAARGSGPMPGAASAPGSPGLRSAWGSGHLCRPSHAPHPRSFGRCAIGGQPYRPVRTASTEFTV
jgi:hypothetical protein